MMLRWNSRYHERVAARQKAGESGSFVWTRDDLEFMWDRSLEPEMDDDE
jgi:hypothetical protein